MDKYLSYEELEQRIKFLEKKLQLPNKAQQQSGDTEARYRLMLESISDTVIMADDLGNMLYVCPNTTNIFGFSLKEIYAQHTIEKLMNGAICDVHDIHKKGEIENIERLIKNSYGDERFLLINAKSVNINGGTVLYAMRDITDRWRAEKVLYESEKKFSILFQNNPFGALITSFDTGRIIELNESTENITGYDRSESIGRTSAEIGFWQKHVDREKVASLLKEKTLFKNLEFEYLHKTGEQKYGLFSAELTTINNEQIIITSILDITDMKKNKKLLREIEEKFRQVLNCSPAVIYTKDLGGQYTLINQQFTELSGYDEKQVIGKTDFELFPESVAVNATRNDRIVIEDKKTIELEEFGPVKGVMHNFLTSKYPLFDKKDNVIGVCGVSSDITGRKLAESKLRDVEAYLKSTSDISPFIIGKANIDTGYFVEVSAIVTELLGYSVEEFTSRPILELLHPDDKQRTIEGFAKQKKGKQIALLENRYLCKDGSYKWIAWQGTPVDENGIVSTIGSDITDHKQAEESLRESQLEVQNLLQTIQAGVVVHDVEKDKIKSFNQAALKILGLTSEQLLGKSIMEPCWGVIDENGGTLPVDKYPFNIVKRTKQPLQDYILGIKKPPEPEPTWLIIKANPRFGQHGELKEIIVSSMDISELRKTQSQLRKKDQQLIQAQKMEAIGNLAGGIAHDFNNILSSIIGFTELALESAPKGSSQRDDLEEVSIAGNRARELVQQILAFARQSKEETKPVRLKDIVGESLKLLRPSTPTTIEIIPTIESTSSVIGNTSQLHQVVMNLCTNAIYSLQESGGVLEIGLRDLFLGKVSELPAGAYVELTVTDNGSGIDPAIIENIFEPYFTTKGVGEGTGMGLAMVKGIIESYNGDILVKSEPGKKTSFVIRLPVTTGKSFGVLDQADPVATGTERILFVDDEPPIARMVDRMLETLGYTVTIRTGSFEALELFKEKPGAFDLVITDMTMPYMTGDVLSMEMRKIRHDIPIILCTGYSNKINDEGAKQIGIDAFAYKPFTKPNLAKTIREVLDIKRSSSV